MMSKESRQRRKLQGKGRDTEPPDRQRSWRALVSWLPLALGRTRVYRTVISCLAIFLLSVLLVPKRHAINTELYHVGDVARQDIWAPNEITIEDQETTEAKRKAVAEGVQPIYDYDERAVTGTMNNAKAAFAAIRVGLDKRNEQLRVLEQQPTAQQGATEARRQVATGNASTGTLDPLAGSEGRSARPEIKPTMDDIRKEFETILHVDVPPKEFDVLVATAQDPSIERCLSQAFEDACKDGVVGDKTTLLDDPEKGITIKEVGSGITKMLAPNVLGRIPDSLEAKAGVARFLKTRCAETAEYHPLITSIVSQLIKPTLTFNKSETEKTKQEAIDAVEPVYYKIKKGQIIIRAREVVTPRHKQLIDVIAKSVKPHKQAYSAIGTPLFLALVILLIYLSAHRFGFDSRPGWKNESLFWSIIVLTLLFSKAFLWGVRSLVETIERFPFNQLESYYYAAPLGLSTVLATLLLGKRSGLAAALLASAMVPLLFGAWPVIILATILSGIAVVFIAERYGTGAIVFKMGLAIGTVMALSVLSMQLLDPEVKFTDTGYFNAICAFGQGVVVIAATGILLPILELVFGVWTKSKLLDLASTDRPLIKRLMIEAGGTHNHSLRVGELARSACEAIGANGVVALVSAYYHDIGKLKRPGYFIENTPIGSDNPHDRLTPAMSVRVLVEHVTYGLDLARKKKFPPVILDAIEQHHGVSLIRPFYHKAVEAAKRTGEMVEESEFRYPGVKPKTRETGIIMIADSIEAASRVLANPTKDKISKMVDRIASFYVEDGQLDDCNLTLRDIQKCKESFVLVLQGMLHSRIEYPEDQTAADMNAAASASDVHRNERGSQT
ncbi:MAG: HDIG domain-containing protein [Candidatus Coatesbacteria bacterium]|nr:HDIG domain-containing protein [Candidatus Coatesbacteria bacterium]